MVASFLLVESGRDSKVPWPRATDRRKCLFALMVPEGEESILAWSHGSKQPMWQLEQEAVRSHLQPQPQSREQTGNGPRL